MALRNDKKKTADGNDINSYVSNIVNNISTQLSRISIKTYGSDNSIHTRLRQDLNKYDIALNDIIGSNTNITQSSNIIDLFSTSLKNGAGNNISDLEKFFSDTKNMDAITGIYKQNISRLALYNDYRLICKYMPQLDDCLDTLVDNILSPDDFTKCGIYITYNGQNDSVKEIISNISTKYKLEKFYRRIYHDTLQFGNQYVYVIPYKKAFSKFINAKNKSIYKYQSIKESTILENNNIKLPMSINEVKALSESYNDFGVADKNNSDIYVNKVIDEVNKVEVVHNQALLTEAEKKINTIKNKHDIIKNSKNIYTQESPEDFQKKGEEIIKRSNNGGLMEIKDSQAKEVSEDMITVKGCIIKRLKIENIIPIYINNICLGYYYLETAEDVERISSVIKSPLGKINNRNQDYNLLSNANDIMLQHFSELIVRRLDVDFVNSNPEFKDIIYEFCRANDIINGKKIMKITYLEPDDVIHFKVDEDENGIGRSRLDNALFTAKLYVCILMANMMMKVTRSFDKRAYYVKQGIDKNSAQSIMNVITQIKKNQFNLTDLSNLNRVVSMIGMFNDFFIPVTENGEKPIDFDIIGGQDIEIKTDFLEFLEKISVSSTRVPSAIIDTNNEVDFAKRLSMINAKFLRTVIMDQIDLQPPTKQLVNILIDSELEEKFNEIVDVKLPPPAALNLTNILEQVQNTQTVIEGLLKAWLGDEYDTKLYKEMYSELFKVYLPHVNWEEIKSLEERCLVKIAAHKDEGNTEE